MVATNRFSGGIIINDRSDYVGMYHGVFNGLMGYCVSHEDLKSFLAKHKVVNTTSKHVIKCSSKLVLSNFPFFFPIYILGQS